MSVMRFEEQYEAFNQYGLKMPYRIVRSGSVYSVVDLEPAAGIPPVLGVAGGFTDLPTTQNAVITHAQTYRSTRINAKP